MSRGTAAADLLQELRDDRPVGADHDLLTIDDLHVVTGMPASQVELARRLEGLARSGVRVLAAAGALADIPELTCQLRRFAGAVVIALTAPTTGEMTQILRFYATRAGLELGDRLARDLARRCRGDVRLAQGRIAQLRLSRAVAGDLVFACVSD
jgi:chromosomal replication initiation ATPase DnaA